MTHPLILQAELKAYGSSVTERRVFARTCEECRHIHPCAEPSDSKELSTSYTDRACKACKSRALDYGHHSFVRLATGKVVRATVSQDIEDYLPDTDNQP